MCVCVCTIEDSVNILQLLNCYFQSHCQCDWRNFYNLQIKYYCYYWMFFWYRVVLDKIYRAVKQLCVCVCVCVRVSRYQKGKTNVDLMDQEIVSGSGISWATCKSAPRPRQITMPASHHSVFYRPDILPATQPTASSNWRHNYQLTVVSYYYYT